MTPERLICDMQITGLSKGEAAQLVKIIEKSPEAADGKIALLPDDFEKKDKKEGEQE